MSSTIQWLDGGYTWNPVRSRRKSDGKVGWHCVHESPGCVNCYAEKQNIQCGNNPGRNGTGLAYNVQGLEQVEIFLDEDTLLQPLHWKKGRLVFPCSMTDWMADFVPDAFRFAMLVVMAATPQHTYLTLTKRADLQREFFIRFKQWAQAASNVAAVCGQLSLPLGVASEVWAILKTGILPNHWTGVSAENQKYWDERTRDLAMTPAFRRWVSCEPLLGEIICGSVLSQIDWLVPGGESGPNSRGCNVEWIRSLVHQAYRARKPIFVKQLGANPFLHKQQSVDISKPGFKFKMQSLEINSTIRLSDPKGGDISEWPKDLQIREYPDDRQWAEVEHA